LDSPGRYQGGQLCFFVCSVALTRGSGSGVVRVVVRSRAAARPLTSGGADDFP